MNIPSVVTPPYIYHWWSTHKTFWEVKSTPVNMKICVRRNVSKHRIMRSTSPWTSIWILIVWTRLKSHLQNRKNIWEDQERDWWPHWVSRPLEGQRKRKRQGIPLLMSVWRIFQILLMNFRSFLIRIMCGRVPNMNPLTLTYIYQDILLSVWWDSICMLAL